jgi:drug/metabolite transporter (DMT)-like permease
VVAARTGLDSALTRKPAVSIPSDRTGRAQIPAPDSAQIRRLQRISLAAALVLIVVWGVNFTVQKAVFEALSPNGFLFARYLIMPACAIALLIHSYGLRLPGVSREDFWALARLGFVGHAIHVGMVTHGIHWSTAFSSSVILACGPIFTLLILRGFGIERLAPAQIGGVAIACLGVVLFLSDKLLGGRWQATGGDLFLLVAAAFFSLYTVAAKPMIQRHGGVLVMGYATLLGSVPILVFTLPAGLAVDWTSVQPMIWAGLFWTAVISAFMGWLVLGWVTAVRGVARTAPLMYLMPPVAGVASWLVIDEQFTWIKLAGAAVTLGGVAVAQFTGQPRA